MPCHCHAELTSSPSRLQHEAESGGVGGTDLVNVGKPGAKSAGSMEFFQKLLLSENDCGSPPGTSAHLSQASTSLLTWGNVAGHGG